MTVLAVLAITLLFAVLLGLFGYILIQTITVVYLLVYHFFYSFLFRTFRLNKPLSETQQEILIAKFPYYKSLSLDERKEFGYRLRYFLEDKSFQGRQRLEVTEEMKVLIGSSAIQLTFGFKPLQLVTFKRILLYPEEYYSKITKRNHKGEVNSKGIIVFSWKDFAKGYEQSNDGYNLGLHEMAHALKLEDFIPNHESSFLNEAVLGKWQNITNVEINRIKNKENTFIRPYAATNREEFFAVCVEQFFEQPAEFNHQCPEVYNTLSQLLNQDPLRPYSKRLVIKNY